MNLTKNIRLDLALQLTLKACEKRARGVNRVWKQQEERLYARHCAKLRTLCPKLSINDWSELIQHGLALQSTGSEQLKYGVGREAEVLPRALIVDSSCSTRSDSEAYKSLMQSILREFTPDLRHFLHSQSSLTNSAIGALLIYYPPMLGLPPLPREMLYLNPDDEEDRKMIIELKGLKDRTAKILSEAWAFFNEALDVLNSCRSAKQLEQVWLGAAKLLPKTPPKTVGAIAPYQAAEKLQRRLEVGIPED